MSRSKRLSLLISVFVSGAVVMALELLGSRLLAPVFGNSIFVWGSLIGVVLASLSAGYYLGGLLADRKPELYMLSLVIFVAGLLILALPALAPPVFDIVLGFHLGERNSPLIATMVLLGPSSVLLGIVSPFAIRLAARNVERIGKASGNLYALSTAGSIVGTFVTVFVLIPEFGVNRIIVALGVMLLVVAFIGLQRRMKVFVLLVLVVIPFVAPYLVSHRLTVATYSLALGNTVYETDTPYHHLLVTDAPDPSHQSTTRYLILDDNFHSAMDLNDPSRIVFQYTGYFELPFLLNPNITRVLFVGGGGFSGPKAFLAHYQSVQVDVTEIDAEVIWVAEQYFQVDPSNPRLHIYNQDGRIFLQESDREYDLIILDAYSKSYVPFHLMTLEFFRAIEQHLTSGGIVVSNLISRIAGDGSQLLLAEASTFHKVFPNVYAFAVDGGNNPDAQNIILMPTMLSDYLSGSDFERQAEANTQFTELVRNYITLNSENAPVLTDDFAPVETLLNPITGEPLAQETARVYLQEIVRIVAAAIVLALAFVVLHRKKLI
jgi:spermidine synthase